MIEDFNPNFSYDDYLSLDEGSIVSIVSYKENDYLTVKVSNSIVATYDYNVDEPRYFFIEAFNILWFFGEELNIYNISMLGEFLR